MYKCKFIPPCVELKADEHIHDIELATLREIVDERHALYAERAVTNSTAVAAALAAQKEATAKTESYQKEYNVQHNDLMRKMDHQAESFIGRSEYAVSYIEFGKRLDGESHQRQIDKDAILKRIVEVTGEISKRMDSESTFRMNDKEAIMKEIAALREYNSRGFGEKFAKTEDRRQQNWSTSATITVAIAVFGWIITVAIFLMRVVK